MKIVTMVIAGALLSGCQQQGVYADKSVVDDLRERVRVLEQKQQLVIDHTKAQDAKAAENPASPLGMAYELVGAGAMGASGTKYPTKARCDAARGALLADAADRDLQARAQGAVYISPTAVSCIPL